MSTGNRRDDIQGVDEEIAEFVRETVRTVAPPDLVPSILDAVDQARPPRPWYASFLPLAAAATVVVIAVAVGLLV
jgi:hypothetical protein